MAINPTAEQTFYAALGPDLHELVVLCENGLSIDGYFTPEQFAVLETAYTKYLAIVANPGGTLSNAID